MLHVNLHGYPAHEWRRQHTGYVPRGSRHWAIPKGFFFILNHHPGLRAVAENFVQALSARVARVPGLCEFNMAQLALFAAHAGLLEVPVHDGISCYVNEKPDQLPPFMLTTEYPDETVHGDAFRLAHASQCAAVLEAASLLADGQFAPCRG